jgi:hypothetical protein
MTEKDPESQENEEEDDYLDKVWENWASRRRCEKRHVPNYIKEKKED